VEGDEEPRAYRGRRQAGYEPVSHMAERPRSQASRAISRVMLPSFGDVSLIANLALSSFDETLSLKQRFIFVSTAVRMLVTAMKVGGVGEEGFARVKIMEGIDKAGLCRVVENATGVNPCVGKKGVATDDEAGEALLRIIDMYEAGQRPVSAQAVRVLAQAVLVSIRPALAKMTIRVADVSGV
jgi:hypothetical protein